MVKMGVCPYPKMKYERKRHTDKFSTKSGLIRYQKGIKPGKVSTLTDAEI